MLRQIRLHNSKQVSNVVLGGGRKVVEDLPGSFFQAFDQGSVT